MGMVAQGYKVYCDYGAGNHVPGEEFCGRLPIAGETKAGLREKATKKGWKVHPNYKWAYCEDHADNPFPDEENK